ncbi:MAG: dihydroorotase [Kiritimatiellia bacterium]
MNDTWLITGARVVDPVLSRDEISDIYVENGFIRPVPERLTGKVARIEGAGLTAVPGLIDMHVHFREPGDPDAETLESGSRAASAGGFSTVLMMPNTVPPVDSSDRVLRLLEKVSGPEFARILPAACVTLNRGGGSLGDFPAMAKAGACAFTDDGSTVGDSRLMEQAMRKADSLGKPVLDHALDPSLAGRGVIREGEESKRLGLPGIPAEAEASIVERDIRLARRTGCALHVQHLSSRDSVRAVAEASDSRVSAEVTPHHVALCDADIGSADPDFKMNPPLGSAKDREALRAATAEGSISVFATDHAPHTPAAKGRGFVEAPFGVIGLETAVPVTYTIMVKSGLMELAQWISRWTAGPAKVLNLPVPSLAPGAPADITFLDLQNPYTIRSSMFRSRARNTPFEGWNVTGRAVYTFRNGIMLWNALEKSPGHLF